MVISLPGENKTDHWFDYKKINAVIMFLYGFIGIRCSPTNQPEVFCEVTRPLLFLSPTYKWIKMKAEIVKKNKVAQPRGWG